VTDDGCAIEHYSILLSFIREPHHDPFLHRSDDNSCDTVVASGSVFIDPEEHPVQTSIYGTASRDTHIANKPIATSI
jgi:hypothetical protein